MEKDDKLYEGILYGAASNALEGNPLDEEEIMEVLKAVKEGKESLLWAAYKISDLKDKDEKRNLKDDNKGNRKRK